MNTPADGHEPHSPRKPQPNGCFACGADNPHGMRLHFFIDEDARQSVCRFNLEQRYQGPPGHAHGGIIATILDEAMGKVNKLRKVIALTGEMKIEYLRPVPLGKTLTVTGREQRVEGRAHINVAEITSEDGKVLARSTGTFIAIDPERMFARLAKAGEAGKPEVRIQEVEEAGTRESEPPSPG